MPAMIQDTRLIATASLGLYLMSIREFLMASSVNERDRASLRAKNHSNALTCKKRISS